MTDKNKPTPTEAEMKLLKEICPEASSDFYVALTVAKDLRKQFPDKNMLIEIESADLLAIASRFLELAEDIEFLAIRAFKHGEISKSRTCELLHIDLMAIRKILKSIHKLSGWGVDDFETELARLRKES